MSQEIKQTILSALEVARDDSLERAEQAFRGLNAEQMRQQHGQSGRTRQQILDGYRAHRTANDAAVAWVETARF